ncbi:MAG: Asp-tRNA(Asn)/Glu-tRNA(Gln) amidotransferase GatCAB subunit B, partial [Propionibacteriaceae bacterium]|nr:Asp-tRNA(Asn)/Glu-tRNA(Gln) amidotransferase GatCAB subunit B [Propionibacteriaceae bacterium]
ILAAGGRVKQETRHWNEAGYTTPGRSKEQAEDYRYFPEPDLVPVAPDPAWVDQLRQSLPENPVSRRARLRAAWGLADREFDDVVGVDGALDLIDETVAAGASPAGARKWWMGELSRRANEQGGGLDELAITPVQVAEIQGLVESGALTDRLARDVIDGVLAGQGTPAQVIEARGLAVSDDRALTEAIQAVLAGNPDIVAKIRDGKSAAAGALIGQVMGRLQGKADAARVRALIMEACA